MTDSNHQAGLSKEPFLVMYHGILTTGRGIETLIKLVSFNQYILGVILGNGEEAYVEQLKVLVKAFGVEKRILFHPAVPITELWKYIGAVDLSLIMLDDCSKSYYLALPNKFFESIQALTPIVSSDFPEMKRLIDQYKIGLTCDPKDLNAINDCVERMRTDTAFYATCKENLKRAKEDLCWEKEKQVLVEAFEKLQ